MQDKAIDKLRIQLTAADKLAEALRSAMAQIDIKCPSYAYKILEKSLSHWNAMKEKQ